MGSIASNVTPLLLLGPQNPDAPRGLREWPRQDAGSSGPGALSASPTLTVTSRVAPPSRAPGSTHPPTSDTLYVQALQAGQRPTGSTLLPLAGHCHGSPLAPYRGGVWVDGRPPTFSLTFYK